MKRIISVVKNSKEGIILSLLIGFMFAFYEPLNMFVSSLEDFWFDIYSFLPIIFLQFFAVFLLSSIFFVMVSLINKKAYKIVLLIAFIITAAMYIQGNFLAYNLPGIDGSPIDWGQYGLDSIISIVLFVVVAVAMIVCFVKMKDDNFSKLVNIVSLGITAILFVSTISLLVQPNVFDQKKNETTTFENFDIISKNKNFHIFVIDQADSMTFNNELEKNWDKKEILKDFTYYPDTTSTYLWTAYSIPYILGGEYYENKEPFTDYFTHNLDNAPLLNELEDNGYVLNIYEDEELLNYRGDNLKRFKNITNNTSINKRKLIKQELKYVLFKYLPYPLKSIAKIENLNINNTKDEASGNLYSSLNNVVYDHFVNQKLELVDKNQFNFTHIEGSHAPFRYDAEMNYAFDGTYEDSINASISMMDKYLKRLRESGAYDNSVIIVIADHGYSNKSGENSNFGDTIERSNPILYIKGFNEEHEYRESSQKVSFEDLNDAYKQLISGDKTEKLFQNIDNSSRRILYCELYHCDHLEEMQQLGNAWDSNTIQKTGRSFDR